MHEIRTLLSWTLLPGKFHGKGPVQYTGLPPDILPIPESFPQTVHQDIPPEHVSRMSAERQSPWAACYHTPSNLVVFSVISVCLYVSLFVSLSVRLSVCMYVCNLYISCYNIL